MDVDIRGSQAYAHALERVGILTTAEREQLVAAFDQLRQDARSPQFAASRVAVMIQQRQSEKHRRPSVCL